ncbi:MULTISPECIES: trypco2 family protein [unclassified Frankia]|uniref:trypco2 family protein n=1 Tax=unclassified Frankia TaxID=2632575 RepID=UPI0020254588
MADEPWVELSDAIGALRRELAAARLAGAGEPARFALGPVELEFALERVFCRLLPVLDLG